MRDPCGRCSVNLQFAFFIFYLPISRRKCVPLATPLCFAYSARCTRSFPGVSPLMTKPDYQTAPQPISTLPPGIPYIVGNEAAERFSFYGMKAILTV